VTEIRTQIDIAAPAERVWKILTNFAAYQDWNPFMRNATCPALKHGTILEIAMLPPDAEGWTFHPVLITVQPERELAWRGHFILPGLFDSMHSFAIDPLDAHHVRFVQSEKYSGLLVRLFRDQLTRNRAGFEEMNRALKSRAESSLIL
jgi:hypothetical protein